MKSHIRVIFPADFGYRRDIPKMPTVFVPRVVIPLVLERYTKYIFSPHMLREAEIGKYVAGVSYFKITKSYLYVKRLHQPKGK